MGPSGRVDRGGHFPDGVGGLVEGLVGGCVVERENGYVLGTGDGGC